MFQSFKSRKILAVDLQTSCLKLVEVTRKSNCLKTLGCASSLLSDKSYENPSILNINKLALSLKALIRRSGFSAKNASLSLPDALTRRRIIQLGRSLSEREQETFILMEVEQLFSNPLSEIAFDYIRLPASTSDASLVDILIIAVLKTEVDVRQALLLEADLKPERVTTDSFALKAAMHFLYPQENGVRGLFLLQEERLVFCVFKQAEIIFSDAYLLKDQPVLDLLLKSLHLFISSNNQSLCRLSIAGENNYLMKKLAASIEQKTGIPTEIADPLTSLSKECVQDWQAARENTASFLLALGLSLV